MRRRQSASLWAAGLAAIMVAVYLFGIVTYEPATFQVTWRTDGSNEVNEWSLGEGASTQMTFLVPSLNLTAMSISLAWIDEVAPDDRFRLNVTGPFGAGGQERSRQVTGTTSPLVIEIPVLAIPTPVTLEADDAQHAMDLLGEDHAPWRGNAEIRTVVTLLEANGVTGNPAGVGDQPDDGNDIRVSLAYTQYRAALTPV